MLFDAVRRFVALSGQLGVKGSDPSVRGLMTALRRGGFSSNEVGELSGGKWSGTLVRQYTAGWGGVDDSLDTQRQSMMTVLRGLASSGISLEDVEFALSLDRSVRAKGSSLEEMIELNANLGDVDLQPGEIGRLVALSRNLRELGLTPGGVWAWITMDRDLAEEGFNKHVRSLIYGLCEKHGGLVNVIEGFKMFNELSIIQLNRARAAANVSRLRSEARKLRAAKDELAVEIQRNQSMVDEVKYAVLAGFTAISLTMVSMLAEDLGGPYEVVNAIKKYRSLKEMDEILEEKEAETEKLEKELSQKRSALNALEYTLREAEREYSRNSDVRLVVELLVNPRWIKMERSEVMRLLTRVLESVDQRIQKKHDELDLPSPAMDAALENIKALAERLRSLSFTEAESP